MDPAPLDDAALDSLELMFPEPERPKSPPPTVQRYERDIPPGSGQSRGNRTLEIRLVGQHPLWGHHLWNAGKTLAAYLDTHCDQICKDKRILELGAGGGLPSLVAASNQASEVIITDYPDPALVDNLRLNVQANLTEETKQKTTVKGFIWGADPTDLVARGPFDVVILADLVFNHSQHEALIRTCNQVLRSSDTPAAMTPCVLVFYTHHRPWLASKDMEFFQKAADEGWICERIVTEYTGAMFKEDAGDEKIRGTVHGWRLQRRAEGPVDRRDRKSVV